MKIYSQYGERPKFVESYNSGELKVEKAGYQPAYKEISQMIASGERFEKSRQFDYKNELEIEKGSNHVDTSDMDKFEQIMAARNVQAQLKTAVEEEARRKAKEASELARKRVIEEYEASKAQASKQSSGGATV